MMLFHSSLPRWILGRLSEKNQFEYMLEGLDEQWISLGTKHDLTFIDLKPGAYTLRVRGANNDGVWNEEEIAIELIVVPPFWQTWWFRLLVGFGVMGSLILIYQLRTRSIRASNRALQAEIEERKRVEAALLDEKQYTAQLEHQRAEVEKLVATGRMAAGIAHEINNPLASITSAFELVAAAIPETHPHYEFVQRIEHDLDRVATIIRHMYNLYKPVQEEAQWFSVETMLSEVYTLLEPRCRHRQVQLVVTATGAPDRVYLPQRYVHQVLINVIQNAIEASSVGGVVKVVAETDGRLLRLTIKDEGAGIALSGQHQIFEPFYSSKEGEGMGLGLSISQSLVGAMGGTITFESRARAGTIFHIMLPLAVERDLEEQQVREGVD